MYGPREYIDERRMIPLTRMCNIRCLAIGMVALGFITSAFAEDIPKLPMTGAESDKKIITRSLTLQETGTLKIPGAISVPKRGEVPIGKITLPERKKTLQPGKITPPKREKAVSTEEIPPRDPRQAVECERPPYGDISGDGNVCTEEYDPVCAMRDTGIRCVKPPCPSAEWRTYGNACTACRDDKVYRYVEGECVVKVK